MDSNEQKRQIWTVGVKLLVDGNKLTAETARRILGKLTKQYSQELLATAIEVAVAENAVDPKAFIVAVMRERSNPTWRNVGKASDEIEQFQDCSHCVNTRRQHPDITDWQDPRFSEPCEFCKK